MCTVPDTTKDRGGLDQTRPPPRPRARLPAGCAVVRHMWGVGEGRTKPTTCSGSRIAEWCEETEDGAERNGLVDVEAEVFPRAHETNQGTRMLCWCKALETEGAAFARRAKKM
jgi:hypothetical protein